MTRRFPDLSYEAFQHPLDRQAITGLKRVKGLDKALSKISEWFSEKSFRLNSLSNNVRLGPNQGASIYRKFVEAAEILDL